MNGTTHPAAPKPDHAAANPPNHRIYEVLFICTHNSARSILGEGLLNSLGKGRFRAHSAGSQPSGSVKPLALRMLERSGIPTDGFRSKDWAEFARSGAPALDFVFTVCDRAAGEVCPVWPGQPMTAHWGMPDPSEVQGSEAEQASAFWDTTLLLKRRIELMLALPIASLDRLSLQREVQAIGRS